MKFLILKTPLTDLEITGVGHDGVFIISSGDVLHFHRNHVYMNIIATLYPLKSLIKSYLSNILLFYEFLQPFDWLKKTFLEKPEPEDK